MVLLVALLAVAAGYLYTQTDTAQSNSPDTEYQDGQPSNPPQDSGNGPGDRPGSADNAPDKAPGGSDPSRSQPPRCGVVGWSGSVYNEQTYIPVRVPYDGSGSEYKGVILNRNAVVGTPYRATGAESVRIDCDQPVTVSQSSFPGDVPVDITRLSSDSVRISPRVNGPAGHYRSSVSIFARDSVPTPNQNHVELLIFVHGGERYSHFAIARHFDVSQSPIPGDVVRSSSASGQLRERLDSYHLHLTLSAGGESTRHLLCAAIPGYVSGQAPVYYGGTTTFDGCYIVQSRLQTDGSLGATPESDILGFLAIVPRKTGEVLEYIPNDPFRINIAENAAIYTYRGRSYGHLPGSIQVTGLSGECIQFTTSYLAYTEQTQGRYFVRWCRDEQGEGFAIDSITPVPGVNPFGPIVQTANIRQISAWSSSDGDNERGSTSLPQEYELSPFTGGSGLTDVSLPRVGNDRRLYGIAVTCTANRAPTIDRPEIFHISQSPAGSTDVTLPDFYWLFFTGDLDDRSLSTANLRCGSLSVPVTVGR